MPSLVRGYAAAGIAGPRTFTMSSTGGHVERCAEHVSSSEEKKRCCDGPLNVAVVYGSVRTARMGIGAAKFVAGELESTFRC